MPVPGRGIEENLPHFYSPCHEQPDGGSQQRENADHQVRRVSDRQQIEEVAARVGPEVRALLAELLPRHHLADKKCRAQDERRNDPRHGAPRCRPTQPKPLFQNIRLVK